MTEKPGIIRDPRFSKPEIFRSGVKIMAGTVKWPLNFFLVPARWSCLMVLLYGTMQQQRGHVTVRYSTFGASDSCWEDSSISCTVYRVYAFSPPVLPTWMTSPYWTSEWWYTGMTQRESERERERVRNLSGVESGGRVCELVGIKGDATMLLQ